MKFHDTLRYLYGLVDYEKRRLERYSPREFKLERVQGLLTKMGNPYKDYPTLHIAGTKGKGSVSATMALFAQSGGLKTGLYTSPHLHTYRERIQINGEPISRDDMTDLVDEIRPLVEAIPGITTFEVTTALAFLYFSQQNVDLAVMEVGLGGRLDATNVIIPLISIITSLSLDHTKLLGDTIDQIAYEKGGIIKPGVPFVTAPQQQEALEVLRTIGEERGSPMLQVGRDWLWKPGKRLAHRQMITVSQSPFTTPRSVFEGEYELALLGEFQQENATVAVAAADILHNLGYTWATADSMHTALRKVHWPGRLEVLSWEPPMVVDCAHNPYSAQKLVESLISWFPGKRWVLIFGASKDKDIRGMLTALLPISEHVIVTRSYHPRAAAPTELADLCSDLGTGAEIAVDPRRALDHAQSRLGPEVGILTTGSVFLVADIREAWANKFKLDLPQGDWVDEPW
jgi:dihydrofolate synthase/folylpolyglutamate synthase